MIDNIARWKFFQNEKWYKKISVKSDKEVGYELTEEGKVIPEVVKSFEDFVSWFNDTDPSSHHTIKGGILFK
ncbi:MAG: hypothetical protein ACK5G7_06885 [Erysipelotrichaceae bacterium]